MGIETKAVHFTVRQALRPFVSGVAVSILALGAALFLMNRAGIISDYFFFTNTEEKPFIIPSEDLVQLRPALIEIRNLADKLQYKIENEAESIQLPSNNKFYHVSLILPDEYKKLSIAAKAGLGFSVRIDKSDYKILLDGKICTIANHDKVFNVDPVREKDSTLICKYFSVWRGEGSKY